MAFIGKRHTKVDKTIKTDKYLTIKPYVFNIFLTCVRYQQKNAPCLGSVLCFLDTFYLFLWFWR